MTDQSNVEHSGKVEPEKSSCTSDDTAGAKSEKHTTNRPQNIAKSKREIMEDLSRERFPWEE
ncbi:hypothetical protein [Polynucleobacter brandtiae]|uniref:Uncharacterized protein n=1 Tax=Polynucleobacter brandtiae TaxID=1938816 RepID=A0A2M8VZ19_9BURK|nr:hypothetical protein [Polynucleobacter brandtiae]PJI83089.1 hypothetical protein B0G85_0480 [Polynucleobacter brandtiae]